MSDAPEKDTAVEAVLALMDGRIERESNRVDEWPEDERDLYRDGDWRSFEGRSEALSRLRAEKIVAAVLTRFAPPAEPDCNCGHPEADHYFTGGAFCNECGCECYVLPPAVCSDCGHGAHVPGLCEADDQPACNCLTDSDTPPATGREATP